jgi:hypothetical protein
MPSHLVLLHGKLRDKEALLIRYVLRSLKHRQYTYVNDILKRLVRLCDLCTGSFPLSLTFELILEGVSFTFTSSLCN